MRRDCAGGPAVRCISAVTLAVTWGTCRGFPFPSGIVQSNYKKGEVLPVGVNSLTSIDGVIPYDFYSLKYCRPRGLDIDASISNENLGEIIWGDHLEPSNYFLEMMTPVPCRPVSCADEADRELSRADLELWEKRINDGYRGNLVLDNLPVLSNQSWVVNSDCIRDQDDVELQGYPLGREAVCVREPDGSSWINNHLAFTVQVNTEAASSASEAAQRYFVVGFYVVPYSVDHVDPSACGEAFVEPPDGAHASAPVTTRLPPGQSTKRVIWSYSVRWEVKKDVAWSTRWDAYLNTSFAKRNARVHWLSITSSLLATLCVAGIVAIILMRALHKDFNRYNNPENEDEMQEEVGWKLVHADVFRAPSWLQTFAVILGTAAQLNGMFWVSLIFALLGFLHPAHRGSLLYTAIILFVLMALANGFAVGTVQLMFHAKKWKTAFASGLVLPGCLFLMWGVTECLLSAKGAANAVHAIYVLQIAGLWFGVSLPLVVLGASFAYRRAPIEPPLKVQRIARQIPPRRWYLSTPFLIVGPGLVPFCSALLELTFICNSIWKGYVYSVFGFLALVAIITTALTGLIVVVGIYTQLVHEDHRWWWSSLIIPSGMGIHFFLFSIYYFVTQLDVRSGLATFMYFEFALAVSSMIAIGMAVVGFISAWSFVVMIYRNIKVD